MLDSHCKTLPLCDKCKKEIKKYNEFVHNIGRCRKELCIYNDATEPHNCTKYRDLQFCDGPTEQPTKQSNEPHCTDKDCDVDDCFYCPNIPRQKVGVVTESAKQSERELKDCPFCGGRVELLERKCSQDKWAIFCRNALCFLFTPDDAYKKNWHNYTVCFTDKGDAIRTWNTRANK